MHLFLEPEQTEEDYTKQICQNMAPFCSIHDLRFGDLVEKYALGIGKELSREVGFVLVSVPYNV